MLTDRYLVATVPHCCGCKVSCIRGYIILMDYVSVAWQWIFPALGNSGFQTTCHNIISHAICHVESISNKIIPD
jgi:hypothetical protein